MKIAIVAGRFPSVSETFIYNHAAQLRAAGFDITVVAGTTSNDAAMFADFDGVKYDGPIVYQPLQQSWAESAKQVARGMIASGPQLALWKAAQREYGATRRALRAYLLATPLVGFDIVHFEFSGLAIAQRDVFPLIRPAKIVTSCRGAAEQIIPLLRPERKDQLRELFAAVDRVHCVSDDMKRTCQLYGLDPEKAFVNRPAIDIRRFQRSAPYVARESGPIRMLSTGRLHWKKGLDYAISAVRLLVDAGHDVHYEILGGGVEEERLRFAVNDLGLDRHVTFAGKRSSTEVRAALERTDIYLLPSLSEGISNAALEAMAMELPIVTTTAGGMAEAVDDRTEGMLVASRDPRAIADRVAELIAMGSRRAALGQAARRRIDREFTLERQVRVYREQYGILLRDLQ